MDVAPVIARLDGLAVGSRTLAAHESVWSGWLNIDSGVSDFYDRIADGDLPAYNLVLPRGQAQPDANKPSKISAPHIIYRLSGVGPATVDGFLILQVCQYEVTIHAPREAGSTDLLVAETGALLDRISQAVYSSTLVDLDHSYVPASESYMAKVVVEVAFLAVGGDLANQSLPAVMVYPDRDSGDSEAAMGMAVVQGYTREFGVAVTDAGDISETIETVRGSLVGWTRVPGHSAIEFVRGEPVNGQSAALKVWRDVYRDQTY